MKILFGVQGTGNGHISRSRTLARALRVRGLAVDYLFSGRPADGYFEMAEFGVSKSYRGLAIGKTAVKALFAKHQGHWRVAVMPGNLSGLRFWRSVVPRSTSVAFSEEPDEAPCMLMSFSTAQP